MDDEGELEGYNSIPQPIEDPIRDNRYNMRLLWNPFAGMNIRQRIINYNQEGSSVMIEGDELRIIILLSYVICFAWILSNIVL